MATTPETASTTSPAKTGGKAPGKSVSSAPPNPNALFEAINARRKDYEEDATDDDKTSSGVKMGLATAGTGIVPPSQEHVQISEASTTAPSPPAPSKGVGKGSGKKGKGGDSCVDPSHPYAYKYSEEKEVFLFKTPAEDSNAHEAYLDALSGGVTVVVPLAPCIYRLTDYTLAKKEPIALHRCVLKLGVLRSLRRECDSINALLWGSLSGEGAQKEIDEETLGATRFMELISSCGLFQKVSELTVSAANKVALGSTKDGIPKLVVQDLDEFLSSIESLNPSLKQARDEIEKAQTVSFFPGLGELFSPGAQVLSRPDGMDGSPLGCGCVQSYYTEELNKATGKLKRQFVIVLEFIVSLGDKLVFIAASDVYPEFNDPHRNAQIKDLKHRKLFPHLNRDEKALIDSLKVRGEFYASVATQSNFLQYHPNSFFPIIAGGGWNSNAVKPLSKGGRVMVDIKRGMIEGHAAVRGADGMSDSVKEAFKLYDQSKKTGSAMPFRAVTLPSSDAELLWSTWPMLVGFSFASRCWGKLVLGVPDLKSSSGVKGLNCQHIQFREKAFEQLVLPEDKKELIRAVARNASGGDDDDDDGGVDVVANKGAASIFLLYGPPGCGKTLTAEAIAELLQKPLYVVTAGDLGVTASEVEKSLGSVLELCQTWDSLVLLDEADIFLEARSSSEIQRNALVCVMLRLLEYYSGCLFLASNRVGNIDPAIASRITVMLGYPALDASGREKVWRNLIGNLPQESSSGVSDQDYSDLSERLLNGRQIKSAIVLARSLAKERKEPLGLKVLKRAVDAVAGEREAAEERRRSSILRSPAPSICLPPSATEESFVPH